jgi:hypothetical protein
MGKGGAPTLADLKAGVETCPDLSAAIRAGILAMLSTVKPASEARREG